jgi:hypothetical protein
VQNVAPVETSSPAQNKTQATNHAEEESIDDYMSRLMQRIRATEEETLSQPSTAKRSEPAREVRGISETVSAAKSPTPQQESSSPTTSAMPYENDPVMPRKAPENRIDLSALRELANQSANSAINFHARGLLVTKMYSKLMFAVMALIAGGCLLWKWQQPSGRDAWFYWAIASFLVAIFWGVQYALLTGRLMVTKSGRISWNHTPTAPKSAAKKADKNRG